VTSNENVNDWIPNSLGSSYFAQYATNPIYNIYKNLLNIHHFKKANTTTTIHMRKIQFLSHRP